MVTEINWSTINIYCWCWFLTRWRWEQTFNTTQTGRTMSLLILSFSIRSFSLFCSRSVFVCQVAMALVSFRTLPETERWNSLKSLACCRMLFKYSWRDKRKSSLFIFKIKTNSFYEKEKKAFYSRNDFHFSDDWMIKSLWEIIYYHSNYSQFSPVTNLSNITDFNFNGYLFRLLLAFKWFHK